MKLNDQTIITMKENDLLFNYEVYADFFTTIIEKVHQYQLFADVSAQYEASVDFSQIAKELIMESIHLLNVQIVSPPNRFACGTHFSVDQSDKQELGNLFDASYCFHEAYSTIMKLLGVFADEELDESELISTLCMPDFSEYFEEIDFSNKAELFIDILEGIITSNGLEKLYSC